MPDLDREQRKIVRLIRREGRRIKDPRTRRVYERAAVQTGLVESGLRNLSYGDADSQGWRQERASLYKDPTNLQASIRRFREEFQQHYDPGERSYEVAAQVQRPREDLRGRYREEAPEAARILGANPRGGGGKLIGPDGPAYRTVPGVDRSAERLALKQAYFANSHNPNALLELKSSLDQAQDTPSQRVRISRAGPVTRGPGKRGRPLPRAVSLVDELIGQHGAPITAKQEPGHASGGDHDPSVKRATARDVGGDEQTRERIFRDLTRRLGVKGAVYKGADINVTRGGVRYQIISRDHGSGPHLHIGMRRA